MNFWQWRTEGIKNTNSIILCDKKPTVIICGGGFNVDNPSQALSDSDPAIESFFDFILNYINTDKNTFKHLICGPLEGKLFLNYFLVRKLLGLISGIPGNPAYPLTPQEGFSNLIDIYEISYSSTSACFAATQELYKNKNYCSADARAFAKILFLPILETFGRNREKICNALDRLTLFGISHGSNFLLELENSLAEILCHMEYAKHDCRIILEHVFSIAISSIAPVTKARIYGFSSIYFEGINDKLAQWINPTKIQCNSPQLQLKALTDRRILVLSTIIESAQKWIEIIPQFDYFWIDNDKAAHYTPFYTLRCIPQNIQPELVERVLRSAVHRHKNPIGLLKNVFTKAVPALDPAVARHAVSEAIDNLIINEL